MNAHELREESHCEKERQARFAHLVPDPDAPKMGGGYFSELCRHLRERVELNNPQSVIEVQVADEPDIASVLAKWLSKERSFMERRCLLSNIAADLDLLGELKR